MIYIEGLGLIDETNSIHPTGRTAAPVTEQAVSFDDVLAGENAKINGTSSYDLNAIFKAAADKYGLSESLLKSVAYTESGYDVNIGSAAGAQGIMQLMPFVSESMGVTDPYDPYQSIMAGAKILAGYRDMYDGNVNLMLAAYNAGAGNVAKYGGIPPFKETQTYVALVKKRMEEGVPEPGQVTLAGESAAAMEEAVRAREIKADEAEKIKKASDSDSLYPYSMFGTPASELGRLSSTLYNGAYIGSSQLSVDELNKALSDDEYRILMYFYDNMLDIIASIGSSGDEDKDSSDDSLTDLLRLGNEYNRLKIQRG